MRVGTPVELLQAQALENKVQGYDAAPEAKSYVKTLSDRWNAAIVPTAVYSPARWSGHYDVKKDQVLLNLRSLQGLDFECLNDYSTDEVLQYAKAVLQLGRGQLVRFSHKSGHQVEPSLAANAAYDYLLSLAKPEYFPYISYNVPYELSSWLANDTKGSFYKNLLATYLWVQAGLLPEGVLDPLLEVLDELPEGFEVVKKIQTFQEALDEGDLSILEEISLFGNGQIQFLTPDQAANYRGVRSGITANVGYAPLPPDEIMKAYSSFLDSYYLQNAAPIRLPQTIHAPWINDLGPVGSGDSQSHFVEDDQQREWIVKEQDKTNACELMSSLVALYLGILTPSPAVINKKGKPCFGSRRVPKAQNGPHDYKSHPDGVKMCLLDLLVCNYDRHPGNMVKEKLAGGQTRIWTIDHGYAFGSAMSSEALRVNFNSNGRFGNHNGHLGVCKKSLTAREKAQYKERLRQLSPRVIKKLVAQVPKEWLIACWGKNQIQLEQEFCDTLANRAKLLAKQL